MKFRIEAEKLKEGLSKIMNVIPSRTTVPILEDVYINAMKTGKILLRATDFDKVMILILDGEVEGNGGKAAVRGKKLYELVKAIPGNSIIEFDKQGEEVIISTKAGQYKIPNDGAENYPEIEGLGDDIVKLKIERSWLKKWGNLLLKCVSKDARYSALQGILFDTADGSVVASDGYKLVYIKLPGGKVESGEKFVVHSEFVKILTKIIDDDFEIGFTNVKSYVEKKGLIFVGRLILEKYPIYVFVLEGYDEGIRVESDELRGVLKIKMRIS